jgi:hypothetical protein
MSNSLEPILRSQLHFPAAALLEEEFTLSADTSERVCRIGSTKCPRITFWTVPGDEILYPEAKFIPRYKNFATWYKLARNRPEFYRQKVGQDWVRLGLLV